MGHPARNTDGGEGVPSGEQDPNPGKRGQKRPKTALNGSGLGAGALWPGPTQFVAKQTSMSTLWGPVAAHYAPSIALMVLFLAAFGPRWGHMTLKQKTGRILGGTTQIASRSGLWRPIAGVLGRKGTLKMVVGVPSPVRGAMEPQRGVSSSSELWC